MTYLLVEDRETRVNNAEVKLDKFFTVRIHNSLDGIKNFNVSRIVGRFGVRELLEVDVMGNLAE